MADREQFSFSNLGVTSTEEVDGLQAGEMFLSSEPDEVKVIPPKKEEVVEPPKQKVEQKKPVKKAEEDEEEEDKTPAVTKELKDKQIYDALEERADEPDDDTSDSDNDTTSPEGEENPYAIIAKELVANGVFTLDEDEEDIDLSSPQELLERFQVEARKQASGVIDKFLGRFGDDYKDMFDNVFVKGINPVDYLNRHIKVQGLKDLDLADEGNQERVVRELYRSEGRSSEYIEKKLTQLKNYNDLLDEATEAQKILVDKEQKEIADSAAKKQAEITRKAEIRTEYVNNVGRILSDKLKTKDFDGIPVDRKFADQTYAYITQERYQTPDGDLLTTFDKDILDLKRPENHEMKVKVAMLLQLLREDPQLTKLAKKAVSKESNELFKGLKKTAMKTGSIKKPESEEKAEMKSWFQ